MWTGPQAQSREARLRLLDRIVVEVHHQYGQQLLAIGLYGSVARGRDGDYSDIELWCVVDQPGLDDDFEWVAGQGKAEINFFGADVIRERAGAVTAEWAIEQGQFFHVKPLYGDPAFFDELRALVMSPQPARVAAVVAEMAVGECYEWMGKLRNGLARGDTRFIPDLACAYATHVALMGGLLHRRLYSTGSALLPEALALPDLPAGFVALAEQVMTGDLRDHVMVAGLLEEVWTGLESWLAAHEVEFTHLTRWPWQDQGAPAY